MEYVSTITMVRTGTTTANYGEMFIMGYGERIAVDRMEDKLVTL
jgi:hypothetical protein